MDYAFLTSYIIFLFLWMASPGPCFALVARNSMKYGIKAGFWTAGGMVLCDAIFIFFAVIGVAEVLSHHPKILNAGKMIGSAYIFYIGLDIFLSTFKQKLEDLEKPEKPENTPKRLFLKGFLTDASNPLLIIGMLAIVLSFFDLQHSSTGKISFLSILIPITTIYVNALVAICFGNPIIRKIVIPYMKWFERIAGILICVLAVMMIIE